MYINLQSSVVKEISTSNSIKAHLPNFQVFQSPYKLLPKKTLNHPYKMQFINASALAFSLFWVSGLASPTPQAGWKTTATIQLANDQSGANANVPVPIDGVKYSVQELWGYTAVAQHGLVFASSAQVTAFDQTTVCTITEESGFAATLDAQRTWVSADRRPVDLCSAFVVCKCERT